MQIFLESTRKPKVIAWNLASLVKNYPGIIVRQHHTDQKTNGVAERAVRGVREGTSAVLLQSGLDEKWWADSMECCFYLRNIQDFVPDGKTPYERRFGVPFNGPVIPIVTMVRMSPYQELHQFGPKVLPGTFVGYVLYAGGIWKGDIMVVDSEELEKMDASELHARRPNAKEVSTPMKGENFKFPIADGTVKNFWRRPGSENTHLNPGSPRPRRRTRNSSGRVRTGFLPTHINNHPFVILKIKMTHRGMMVKLGMISGPFQAILFIVITLNPKSKLYVPREESFPIPLTYIDFSRNTHTSFVVMLEKSIDDYWNVDGARELSDTWTGFTRFTFFSEKPPDVGM